MSWPNDPDLRLDMEFMPGDMQFLHNHTILHARTAFEDWPEPERKRHLLRLWLAAARRAAAAAGLRRVLRQRHDRRPRRHHLQGHAAARAAGAGVTASGFRNRQHSTVRVADAGKVPISNPAAPAETQRGSLNLFLAGQFAARAGFAAPASGHSRTKPEATRGHRRQF